jgi:hypothetical protein
MKRRLRLPSPAMIVACIALLIALGGTSYAAITLPTNSVGTKQLKKNAVISTKVKDRSLLAKDFKAGQLPRGAKGDKGDKGDTGTPGSADIRWANISGDGTILAQSGGITVIHGGVGFYFVTYPVLVVSKPIQATLSRVVGGFTGEVTATPCGGAPQGVTCGQSDNQSTVLVDTLNSAGTLTDHSFYVSVVG